MTGQSLIRAAELRSVTTEHQQFETAVMTFKNKYFAIPGDMRNATAFWETATNCGALIVPLEDGTCNGDGDAMLEQTVSGRRERFLFWDHLELAGLMNGQFTGTANTGGQDATLAGINVPRGKVSNSVWHVRWRAVYGGATFGDVEKNHFIIGNVNDGSAPDHLLLTTQEAWSIDEKVDDGKVQTGRVHGYGNYNHCGDAASMSEPDADYNFSNDSLICGLVFIAGF